MDEVSNCAHLLSQHAPLNSPIVCKTDGLSFGLEKKKRLQSNKNIDSFKQDFLLFSTGNAAYDIQLGGKS